MEAVQPKIYPTTTTSTTTTSTTHNNNNTNVSVVKNSDKKQKIWTPGLVARKSGTSDQLKELVVKIQAQSEALRNKKNELGGQGEGAAWRKEALFDEIFKLMNLKYSYCRLSPTPITIQDHKELFVDYEQPLIIKLRWKVKTAPDSKDHGKIITLQIPFKDVTQITGAQILEAVKSQTYKNNKLPYQNGFVKIEYYVTDSLGNKDILETEQIVPPVNPQEAKLLAMKKKEEKQKKKEEKAKAKGTTVRTGARRGAPARGRGRGRGRGGFRGRGRGAAGRGGAAATRGGTVARGGRGGFRGGFRGRGRGAAGRGAAAPKDPNNKRGGAGRGGGGAPEKPTTTTKTDLNTTSSAPAANQPTESKNDKGKEKQKEQEQPESSTQEGGGGGSASTTTTTTTEPTVPEPQTIKIKRKKYRTLLETDIIRLPLNFPGPILQPVFNLSLRVTFPDKPSNIITPKSYTDPATPITLLPELIDCGVNLFDSQLTNIAASVVDRAVGAGVSQMVLISVSPKTSEWNVQFCQLRQRSLYCVVGVHPDDAQTIECSDEHISKLKSLLKEECVVGIGECGLDTKRAAIAKRSKEKTEENAEEEKARIESNMQKQEKWLETQIELALEAGKPLLFHERDCGERFLKVVDKYGDKLKGKCVINCFTGSRETLKRYVEKEFYIGITGFLCNKARGEELQGMLKEIPMDRIMLGSDAPYLIPFTMEKPYPKFNEPAYLHHILVLAAQCIGCSVQELASATTRNVRKLFGLPVLPYDGTIRKFATYSANVIKSGKVETEADAKTEESSLSATLGSAATSEGSSQS